MINKKKHSQGIKCIVLKEKKKQVKVPNLKKTKYQFLTELSSKEKLKEVPLMIQMDILS